jgi:hypothetical protein
MVGIAASLLLLVLAKIKAGWMKARNTHYKVGLNLAGRICVLYPSRRRPLPVRFGNAANGSEDSRPSGRRSGSTEIGPSIPQVQLT